MTYGMPPSPARNAYLESPLCGRIGSWGLQKEEILPSHANQSPPAAVLGQNTNSRSLAQT